MKIFRSLFATLLLFVASALLTLSILARGQESGETAVVKPAPTQFGNVPSLPDCFTVASQQGDPAKGPSVLLIKGTGGCSVPWHWHSPNEQLMMVSGAGRVQMKDDKPVVLRAGGFAYAPSHHVHRLRCLGACMAFLHSDGPFDIHYVDATGKEISSEEALKGLNKPAAPSTK